MAIVIIRGKKLHIQYYDPYKKKTTSKSTGLTDTKENLKKAKNIADEFQKELSESFEKTKENPLRIVTIKIAFEDFKDLNRNMKKKTLRDYDYFFSYFKKFFNEEAEVSSVNKVSYDSWLASLEGLDLKPNTKHAIGKQGMNFLNFLLEYNYIDTFTPSRRLRTRPQKVEIVIFDKTDLKSIFSNLKDESEQFSSLLMALAYSGIRAKDILSITKDDVNLEKKEWTYVNNKDKRKGIKKITVPIHSKIIPIIKKRMKNLNDNDKLWNYRDEDSVSATVRRYFKKINIYRAGKSSRTFRKTFISTLRNIGADQSIVQRLVGHVGNSVMDLHYYSIDNEMIREMLNKLKY